MPHGIIEAFLTQGLAGTVALVALWWAWRKDRDLKEERTKLDQIHRAHKEEMKALEERFISKAETWMEKYYELSGALHKTLEAIEKVVGRRRNGFE